MEVTLHLETLNQAPATKGAIRSGPALLAGLVVCSTWHVRMLISYGGSTNQPL